MSTSLNREQAMFYAKGGVDTARQGKAKILIEIEMGMIDKGADLDWLSEFQGEQEILFAPLTGLELRGSRVEDAVLIYEAVLTINLNAKTLEQVVAKMRRAHLDLVQLFIDGFAHSAAPEDRAEPWFPPLMLCPSLRTSMAEQARGLRIFTPGRKIC